MNKEDKRGMVFGLIEDILLFVWDVIDVFN